MVNNLVMEIKDCQLSDYSGLDVLIVREGRKLGNVVEDFGSVVKVNLIKTQDEVMILKDDIILVNRNGWVVCDETTHDVKDVFGTNNLDDIVGLMDCGNIDIMDGCSVNPSDVKSSDVKSSDVKSSDVKKGKFKKEDIKTLLETNDMAVVKGILNLYCLQTEDEKRTDSTQEVNGLGFNGLDAEFMSSLAVQIIKKSKYDVVSHKLKEVSKLSDKQMKYARKKMIKYAGQLCKIANGLVEVDLGKLFIG